MILSNGQAVTAQIAAIGDRVPVFADTSYYGGSAIQLSGLWASYGAMYKTQLWVKVVINKLGMGTARLPFGPRRQIDENSQQTETGPLADLLAKPNPGLDAFRLWLWTSNTFDIYGEAFWLKLRDSKGRVRELYPMHPSNVIVRRDPDSGELFYIYASGVRNVSVLPPIPAADVVPFLTYNPDMLERGMSNMEPLRQTLLNEDAARRATSSWWEKGARPSVALQHPKALSDDAQKRLLRNWNSMHAGADRMGGTAVLEEGMKAQVIQLTAEEMQYIESRKLNREEVCGAYDVPPPVVHILDRATFSNITEQMRSMYRDTMTPRLRLFESAIDFYLVPEFYPGADDVMTRFSLQEVLRGDWETRAAAATGLVQTAIYEPAEARSLFELPDAGPASHKLYANSAMQELGKPAERISITAGSSTQPIQATPGQEQEVADAEAAGGMGQQSAQPAQPAPVNGGQQLRQLVGQPAAPVRRGGRPPKSNASQRARGDED